MEDGIAGLVNAWALAWSVVLMAGYLADFTPWGWLKSLRERGVVKHMLLSTGALMLGLTLAGAGEHGAMLLAWAMISVSVKLLCDSLEQTE